MACASKFLPDAYIKEPFWNFMAWKLKPQEICLTLGFVTDVTNAKFTQSSWNILQSITMFEPKV